MAETTNILRRDMCRFLPCEIQKDIWERYYSGYVVNELCVVAQTRNLEYEKVYEEYYEVLCTLIAKAHEIYTNNTEYWYYLVSNIQDELLEEDNFMWQSTRDMYNILLCVKQLVAYPSLLKVELQRNVFMTTDELYCGMENLINLVKMIA